MARQEARLPNSFTPSLPWRGIIFIAGGDPKIMRNSCENPLSGGERRLQPSGVGPARLEQPTPTPLPRRGIKFIPRGAHFHALWCRPRRHGSAEEFCKVRVVRFIQVAMTKMGAEGKSPPHPVDRVSPQYRPVFHGFGKTLEV